MVNNKLMDDLANMVEKLLPYAELVGNNSSEYTATRKIVRDARSLLHLHSMQKAINSVDITGPTTT